MAAVEAEQPATRRWGQDYCCKRSQALPTHSLFGCNLEMHSDNEKTAIEQLSVKEYEAKVMRDRQAKQRRYKSTLPDYLKKKVKSGVPLEHTKEELEQQLEHTEKARKKLDSLEEKSKYFQVPALGNQRHVSAPGTCRSPWQSNGVDMAHAPKMNSLGLESHGRQKHQTMPPVHQYALIGDPLKLGMELNEAGPGPGSPARKNIYQVERRKAPDRLPREFFMNQYKSQEKSQKSLSAVPLPPNIQHQFGTLVCNEVLCDRGKIDRTLKEQQQIRDCFLKRSFDKPKATVTSPADVDPLYESLGHAIRQNIFPGYAQGHKKSFAHSIYTEDVYKNRVPDTDKYRYHRDQLSIWSEHNVLRERMKRKWAEYVDTLPKAEANWDRNAKRPPPAPKPPEQKGKAKANVRDKKDTKGSNGAAFEDVVFKTPPLTPPPGKLDPTQSAPAVTRDDAFWEFYDQPSG